MNSIEVCLSPALISGFDLKNKTVIVIDVLRATSTFATGLHAGLKAIIPVAEVETAKKMAELGYLTAGEREGKKIEGLAHGNSPTEYLDEYFKEKTLAMTTTNGTKCIALSKDAASIYTVSFNNLKLSTEYFTTKNQDIVVLCSGWKDRFNLEDTWCAGAIVKDLQQSHEAINDSALAACSLYEKVENNLLVEAQQISHYKRLAGNGVSITDISWCFKLNVAPVVVKLVDSQLISI